MFASIRLERQTVIVDTGSKVMTYAMEKLEEESAHRNKRHLYHQTSHILMTILRSFSAYQHKMQAT